MSTKNNVSMAGSLIAVTPVQAAQGIAAIVSIINGLQDLKRPEIQKVLDVCESINRKVDLLLEMQTRVLEELIALRVYFKEVLRKEFLKSLEVMLDTEKDLSDIAIKKWRWADTREEIEAVRKDFNSIWMRASEVILQLANYGPATYQTIPAGYALVRILHEGRRRLATSSADRRVINASEKAYLEKLLEKYNPWIDPANGESFPKALQATIDDRQSLVTEIANHPRKIWLAHRLEPRYHHRCVRYHIYDHHLEIYGTLESGFSDNIVETDTGRETEDECRENDGPRREPKEPKDYFDEQALREYEADYPPVVEELVIAALTPDLVIAMQARARAIISDQMMIMSGTRSSLIASHAITQALNQKRDHVFQLAEQQAALEEVLKNVTAVRDEIAQRIAAIKI